MNLTFLMLKKQFGTFSLIILNFGIEKKKNLTLLNFYFNFCQLTKLHICKNILKKNAYSSSAV